MSRFRVLVIPWLLISCASTGPVPPEPAPRPLGAKITAYRAPVSFEAEAKAPPPESPAPRGEITLQDALAAALMGNPELASASWETRAADARALQASLYPNPELAFEAENFAGGSELSGLSVLELTLAVSQEIPLAGKIGKRTEVARIEGRLADWEYEEARLDVLTVTARSFVALLAAQEMVALAEDSVRLSEEVARAVREQREAGKVSGVEEKRAAVALSMDTIRLTRARREVVSARQRLAATWGGTGASFDAARGDLYQTNPVPEMGGLSTHLAANPELARLEDAIELGNARLDAAQAQAWPDVTLTGGVRHFRELDTYGFVAGISVPLPFFDRNQGGVREARADARRVSEKRRSAEVRIETEFVTAWQALVVTSMEAETLRDDVLPMARDAFDASREGFREGKLSHLEVLVAQRIFFEAREQLVGALSTYHQAVADVERLVGRSLTSLETGSQEKP